MASLGELVATMSLNTAQFVGALSKVEQAVADSTRQITKQFEQINGSLTGLVTGFLSVSTAMDVFTKAVDRGAELKDMGAAFDISVEKMDQLSLAMQLAGTDSATLEKQMKTLANQVTLATNPASKQAEVFAAMGVSIKDASGQMRAMDDIYKDAIRQLGAIEDPTLRASAAMQLFGKGADDALKATAQIDGALDSAQKQMDAFGGTTDDVAKMSKDFKDGILLAQDAMQRLMLPIVKALLPVFADLREAFAANNKGGVDLAATIGTALATAFRTMATGAIIVVGVFKAVGLAIGANLAALSLLAHGDIKGAIAAVGNLTDDLKQQAGITFDSANAMLGLTTAHTEAAAAVQKNTVNNAALTAALNKSKAAADDAAKAWAAFSKVWNKVQEDAAAFDAGDKNVKLEKQMEDVNTVLAQTPENADMAAKALQLYFNQTNDGTKYMKAYNDELNKGYEEYGKYRDALVASWTAMEKQNETLEEQVKTTGLLDTERELAISQMQRQHAIQEILKVDSGDIAESDIKQTNALYDQRDALIKAKGAAADYAAGLAALGSALESGIGNLFDTLLGKANATWKSLWQSFKDWAYAAFKEVAARQIVVSLIGSAAAGPAGANTQLVNALTGGALSSATSGLFGSAGAGLLSSGVGAIGSAGLFATAGGASASQAAILASQTAGFGVEGTASTLSALGAGGAASMMTTLTPLLAAAPYVAAAAAIAYTVYNMVAQKAGGPKVGGFAETGTEAGRYYTPDQTDATLKTIVDTQQAGYASLVAALGGTATAHFALGYDTDPQGTAGNRITAGVFSGGKQVYGVTNLGAGTDDASLQTGLTTQTKRMLLAAVQDSSLPAQLAQLVNSLSAATATDAQVDQMMATAQTVVALNAALAQLGDPMTAATAALATASQTALGAWEAQRDALYDLANAAPDTADGLNSVTAATQAFAQSTVQLLAGIMNAKKALDSMFESTRDTIAAVGKTNDQLYAEQQAKAQTLFAQLQTATDPDQINTLAQQINDAINTAFGMLSPADQAAQQAAFLAGLDQVQQTTDARLQTAMDTVATQTKTDQQFMSDKLDEILKGIEAAANTFAGAANGLANGVPVTVTVQNTPAPEVNG